MKYALLIGLNYSNTNSRLYGCINDCLLIHSMLINNYGYDINNIVFMRDDIYLVNNNLYPNKNNIINQINQLVLKSKLSNCISLYLHYSGHGSQMKDVSGDERDGLDEFIVPSDYFTNGSRIIDDELKSLIINVGDNIPFFTIFDCCNSGTLLDLNYSYGYVNNTLGLTIDDGKPLSNKKIICLSACKDHESALDVTVGGSSNGALTLALYSALQSAKWNMLLKDLLNNIYIFLKHNKYTQMTPIITSNLLINLNTQLFHNVINATVTTTPTTTPTTASTTNPVTTLANPTTTTTVPTTITTTVPTSNPTTTTVTNQNQTNNTTSINSTSNLFTSGITNSTTNTSPSEVKPNKSNVNIIKSLLEHLISSNYITRQDLSSLFLKN